MFQEEFNVLVSVFEAHIMEVLHFSLEGRRRCFWGFSFGFLRLYFGNRFATDFYLEFLFLNDWFGFFNLRRGLYRLGCNGIWLRCNFFLGRSGLNGGWSFITFLGFFLSFGFKIVFIKFIIIIVVELGSLFVATVAIGSAIIFFVFFFLSIFFTSNLN
jgi:hypothetical protein